MPLKSHFIDQAKIFVKAGDGGDGHVGFRREKFIPKGGPDGGDGGRGGDVVLVGSQHMGSLQDFQFKRHFRAGSGDNGGRNQRTGRDGDCIELRVPLGTMVFDSESDEFAGELLSDGQRLVIAEGGKGGLGNIHFKTSTNRAPRKFIPGVKREGKWIRLEMRLLADVGLVGPPNAGKSTLLGALTAARPKVGAYPFTTLSPSLGMLDLGSHAVALADVPGLIEGASKGVGLGVQFLRHIARTRALLFLIPSDAGDPDAAWNAFKTTRAEITKYDKKLSKLPMTVVFNKIDLKSPEEVDEYVRYFRKKKVTLLPISAQKKLNLEKLKNAIKNLLFPADPGRD